MAPKTKVEQAIEKQNTKLNDALELQKENIGFVPFIRHYLKNKKVRHELGQEAVQGLQEVCKGAGG